MILGFETLTRTRYAAGSWGTDGRWDSGSSSTASISASVQPASGKVLATLAEGERTRDPRQVWTRSELRTLSQADGTEADRLTIDGAVYELREVKHYRSPHPLPHYEGLALRVQEAGTDTREDSAEYILQGVRVALKEALSLDDGQVIVYASSTGGPRPSLPYLAVRAVADQIVGQPDLRYSTTGGGDPQVVARGHRQAQVSVFGYGDGALDLLERFRLALALPTIADLINTAGFSLDPDGSISSSPTLLDTSMENRWQADFTAIYALDSEPEELVEVVTGTVSVDMTGQTRTTSVTITLS